MNEHHTRTRRRWLRILAPPLLLVLAAAALAVGCSSDDEQPTIAEQPVRSEQPIEQQEQQEQADQQSAPPPPQVEYEQEQQQQVAYEQEQQAAEQQQQSYQYEEEQQQADMQQQADYAQAEQQSASSSRRTSGTSSSSSEEQAASRPPPSTTTFEDYPTTGWRESANDNTTTFSLDVDRTSYFLALNWVQNGYAIEPASVRAEEWINAFNYRYAQPNVDDSFNITSDLVEHPLHDSLHLVRVAAQAPEFVDDRPVNVTLVLDSSGSMREGGRVEIARAAAEAIQRGLNRDDRLAVVLFSDGIVDSIDHRQPDDRDIQRVIDWLAPRQSTNVQAGLNLGVELADDIRRERPDAYNYIILMSDGVANVDATDPFAILRTAEDQDDRNPLRLITIGVGIANYNDVLLEQLAQHGNGWYRYLQDSAQARATFSRENWLRLSTPFADQARAQVRWNADAVLAWRQVGYENRITSDRNFEQDRKEFAEIPVGTATTVFFEVELTDAAKRGGPIELGEVELKWLTPQTGDSNTQQQTMVSRSQQFGDDQMLDLGTVVALAADRYSWFGQDGISESTINLAAEQLHEIAYWFEELPRSIHETQAGQDFALLLRAMGGVAVEYESEDPGYAD